MTKRTSEATEGEKLFILFLREKYSRNPEYYGEWKLEEEMYPKET